MRAARPGPDLAREAALGPGPVAGIDEVGRGPWAGPLVAAAVILDVAAVPGGLDDSKRVPAARRVRLAAEIEGSALVGLGLAEAGEIDALGLTAALDLAMGRAVAALPCRPAALLVDGTRLPPLGLPGLAVVGGDGLSASIAAASIVAKVARDAMMAALDRRHPGYAWARNKGYGTPEHARALATLGPSPEHRRSFRPVALHLA